jgi:hypothetical protein
MKRIKRVVDTGIWNDEKVMEFSPEDKYFWLFLLTNEYTTQLGIYYLPIKKAAFDLGYSEDSVKVLIERFANKYGMIEYSKTTSEVLIKNYLIYAIMKGGKPVYDCLVKEANCVEDTSLLSSLYNHLSNKQVTNDTVLSFLEYLNTNNNDNDNDNERIVDESSTNRGRIVKDENIIPPTFEMVDAYCRERDNGIDAQKFIDFYESKGWLIGKTKMKNWKAAVRTWEQKDKPQKRNGWLYED